MKKKDILVLSACGMLFFLFLTIKDNLPLHFSDEEITLINLDYKDINEITVLIDDMDRSYLKKISIADKRIKSNFSAGLKNAKKYDPIWKSRRNLIMMIKCSNKKYYVCINTLFEKVSVQHNKELSNYSDVCQVSLSDRSELSSDSVINDNSSTFVCQNLLPVIDDIVKLNEEENVGIKIKTIPYTIPNYFIKNRTTVADELDNF